MIVNATIVLTPLQVREILCKYLEQEGIDVSHQDISFVVEAIECGITDVGENKPQELARKYDVIGDKVRWHLIGSLQTNKVKYIIANFLLYKIVLKYVKI